MRCTWVLGKTTVLPSGFWPYWTGWNNLKRIQKFKVYRKVTVQPLTMSSTIQENINQIHQMLMSFLHTTETGKTHHFSKLQVWTFHKVILLSPRRNLSLPCIQFNAGCMRITGNSLKESSLIPGKRMGISYHFQRDVNMSSGSSFASEKQFHFTLWSLLH